MKRKNNPYFSCKVNYFDDLMYIVLRGKLNILENIDEFENIYNNFLENGRKNARIYLREVIRSEKDEHKSLDTAVLSILVKFKREVDKRKGKLEVYLTSDQCKIFNLSECEGIFNGCLKKV